jgi:hypothetical protein
VLPLVHDSSETNFMAMPCSNQQNSRAADQGIGLVVGGGAVLEQRQAERQAQLLGDIRPDVAPRLQSARQAPVLKMACGSSHR